MVTFARVVTLVDVDDGVGDPRQLSLSARHEAVLKDGRRVPRLEADHWARLNEGLGQLGVAVDALDLKRLSRDVVLSKPLLTFISREPV